MALLDTGASRSCISKTFADQLKINILSIENNDKFLTFQAANGNNLQIAGQVEISIKLSGCHIPQWEWRFVAARTYSVRSPTNLSF